MIQEVIVYMIGIVAAVFIAVWVYRMITRRKGAGCGCGSSGCGPDIFKEARKAAKQRRKDRCDCECGS